jgi:ATP-dependent Clp protease ATP-binding subunit ClpC
MTSNLPVWEGHAVSHIGFGRELAETGRQETVALREALRKSMTPEFVNRIDEVIVFRALEADDLTRIARKLLVELGRRALDQNVLLEFSDEAVALVVEAARDPAQGARQLGRAVDRLIGRPLGEALIHGRITPGQSIQAAAEGGRIVFRPSDQDDDEQLVTR